MKLYLISVMAAFAINFINAFHQLERNKVGAYDFMWACDAVLLNVYQDQECSSNMIKSEAAPEGWDECQLRNETVDWKFYASYKILCRDNSIWM